MYIAGEQRTVRTVRKPAEGIQGTSFIKKLQVASYKFQVGVRFEF